MYYVRRSFALVVLFLLTHTGFAAACPPGGGDPNPTIGASLPGSVAYGSGTFYASTLISNNTCSAYTLNYLIISITNGSGGGATLVVPSISGTVVTTANSSSPSENVLDANAHVGSYKLWYGSGVYIPSEDDYTLYFPVDAGTTTGTAYVSVQAGFSGYTSGTESSNTMSITSP